MPIKSQPHIHCEQCGSIDLTKTLDGASRWLSEDIYTVTCNICKKKTTTTE